MHSLHSVPGQFTKRNGYNGLEWRCTFYEVFFCFVEQPKENYSPYAFAFICGLDEKGVSRAPVYDTLKMER